MNNAPPKKRVLFVCRENRVRSTTAEVLYGARPDLEVRSAGVAEYAAIPLTQDIFDWADEVFVFSKWQLQLVQGRFQSITGSKPVICLNVPDRFYYKCPKLVKKITGKLEPYLGKPEAQHSDPKVTGWSASFDFLKRTRLPMRQVAAWSMLYTIWSWFSQRLL